MADLKGRFDDAKDKVEGTAKKRKAKLRMIKAKNLKEKLNQPLLT